MAYTTTTMSEHQDLTNYNVAESIRLNLSGKEAMESYADMIAVNDYDDEMANPTYILETAKSMYEQNDGLYGITRQQIFDWLNTNLVYLVIGGLDHTEKYKR